MHCVNPENHDHRDDGAFHHHDDYYDDYDDYGDDDLLTENLWINGRFPQSCLIAVKYWSVLPFFTTP